MSNEKTNNQKISNEKVNVNIDNLGIDKLNTIENQIKALSNQTHMIHLTLDTTSIQPQLLALQSPLSSAFGTSTAGKPNRRLSVY